MTARDDAPAANRARNVLARMEKIAPQLLVAETTLLNPPRVWTQVGICPDGKSARRRRARRCQSGVRALRALSRA